MLYFITSLHISLKVYTLVGPGRGYHRDVWTRSDELGRKRGIVEPNNSIIVKPAACNVRRSSASSWRNRVDPPVLSNTYTRQPGSQDFREGETAMKKAERRRGAAPCSRVCVCVCVMAALAFAFSTCWNDLVEPRRQSRSAVSFYFILGPRLSCVLPPFCADRLHKTCERSNEILSTKFNEFVFVIRS